VIDENRLVHASDDTSDYSDVQAESSDFPERANVADYRASMAPKDLDPVRQKLSDLVEGRDDVSLRGLSEHIGKKITYLSDFLTKRSPRTLHPSDAIKIAKKLGISPTELGVDHTLVDSSQEGVATSGSGRVSIERGRTPPKHRDLPILGYVKAGEVGFFLDQGVVGGFAMRPSDLEGIDQAYAVRVYDDSMKGKLHPNWVLQVDPFRHPQPGDFVVVQLHDGQAFVKALVRRTAKSITCEQFNPPKQVEYPTRTTKLHLVVGIDLISR